jgi:cyclase
VVFSGDLFCELGLPAFVEARVFEWLGAARFLETIDAEWIVPGHGAVSRPADVGKFRQQMEDLIGEVERGIARGDSREVLAADIRFEDRIHISTGGSPSYPEHLIELFQRKSIEAIHDQLLERQAQRSAKVTA